MSRKNVSASLLCKHCQKNTINGPRGLCKKCYGNYSIRYKYPTIKPNTITPGNGLGTHSRPQSAQPTDTQPGSEERIRAYEARAASEESLWHPQDHKPRDE